MNLLTRAAANDTAPRQPFNRAALLTYCNFHFSFFSPTTAVNTHMKQMLKMNDMIGNRMTCLYFVYCNICLIKAEDECVFTPEEVREWVYSQQIKSGGFRGGPYLGFSSDSESHPMDMPNLANTYCALMLLLLTGDYSLEKVNKKGLASKLHLF